MSLIERSFREKIVLVGVTVPPSREDETERHLDELALLVDTAGADEAARVVQRRDHPDPATYVGKGKAEELRELSDGRRRRHRRLRRRAVARPSPATWRRSSAAPPSTAPR